MVPSIASLPSGPCACLLRSSWPPDILAHFLCSQGNLVLVKWAEWTVLGGFHKEAWVEVQFCWKPEKSFLVPLLSRILVFIHFILNSMEGDFYILLSIYKLAQELANSGPGRETQQSLVLTSMRDSCGGFCQLVKLSVPEFLYLSVFLKELLNNETQETLIPRLQLSGSKSYLIDIVLTDILLSLIKCFVDTTESLFIWLSRSWRRKNVSQNSDLFCPRGDRR